LYLAFPNNPENRIGHTTLAMGLVYLLE